MWELKRGEEKGPGGSGWRGEVKGRERGTVGELDGMGAGAGGEQEREEEKRAGGERRGGELKGRGGNLEGRGSWRRG